MIVYQKIIPLFSAINLVKITQWIFELTVIVNELINSINHPMKNERRIPAATALPITPATFGAIACISK